MKGSRKKVEGEDEPTLALLWRFEALVTELKIVPVFVSRVNLICSTLGDVSKTEVMDKETTLVEISKDRLPSLSVMCGTTDHQVSY